MKKSSLTILGVALGLALTCSVSKAQNFTTNSFTNYFGNSGNTTYWNSAYVAQFQYWDATGYGGLAGSGVTQDPSMFSPNSPSGCGSLLLNLPFAAPSVIEDWKQSWGEFTWVVSMENNNAWPPVYIPLDIVTQISFDIFVTNTCPLAPDGSLGQITFGLVAQNEGGQAFNHPNTWTTLSIPTNALGQWYHMVDPNTVEDIANMLAEGDTTNVAGFDRPQFTNAYQWYFTFDNLGEFPQATSYPYTNTFWIANVAYTVAPGPVTPPTPPSMRISKAVPGLTIFAAADTAEFGTEESLMDQNVNAGFANQYGSAQGPQNYFFTINDYSVKPGDAVDVYWYIPFTPNVYDLAAADSDYISTNCMSMDLESVPTGGVVWSVSWKTNQPYAWPSNVVASLFSPTAIGTWTLTISPDSNYEGTNFVMTGPGGVTTNFSFPAQVAPQIGGAIVFGVKAENAAGANDHVTFANFGLSGNFCCGWDFTNDFTKDTAINTGYWRISGMFTPTMPVDWLCLQYAQTNEPYWVQWVKPAVGYNLVTSSSLTGPWTPVTSNPVFPAGNYITQLISSNDLQPGNAAFFQVVNSTPLPATQLQVLLPGESAAPGTPTGKTGTPSLQGVGVNVGLVVNSVDQNWNLVSTTVTDTLTWTFSNHEGDTVQITCTDTTATLPVNEPLAAGTYTFSIAFNTAGTYTVTATDLNAPGITGTSSSVTVE